MIDIQTLPVEKQFSRRLVAPDTWFVDAFVENRSMPHPHVLIGSEKVLVIDTTDLPFNVRAYVETFSEGKQLMVATTHTHGDHAYNNYQFDECPIYMSEAGWASICRVRATKDDPRHHWIPLGNYQATPVKEGDVIPLGDREIECINFCGCHSPSSIAYFDRKYGVLFPGDELEAGQMLIHYPYTNNCVEKYLDNLLHLKAVLDGRLRLICPPHNGSPIDGSFLDIVIENCQRILSGIEGSRDLSSMTTDFNPAKNLPDEEIQRLRFDPRYRRSEWKGSSIIYAADRVFYRDVSQK